MFLQNNNFRRHKLLNWYSKTVLLPEKEDKHRLTRNHIQITS